MSWRDLYGVHPAADVFPMMSDEEQAALGEDIKKNGLRHPIMLWVAERDRNGNIRRGGPALARDYVYVLDGRNRLDAMERVGMETFVNKTGSMRRYDRDGAPAGTTQNNVRFMFERGGLAITPAIAFITSMNALRRHLTREQRRDAIAALLKLAPERSDRQIAEDTGSSPTTVGKVRKGQEALSNLDTQPVRVGKDGRATKPAVERPKVHHIAGPLPAADPRSSVSTPSSPAPAEALRPPPPPDPVAVEVLRRQVEREQDAGVCTCHPDPDCPVHGTTS